MNYYTDDEIDKLGIDKVNLLNRILSTSKFYDEDPSELEQLTIEQLQAMIETDEIKPVSVFKPIKIRPQKLTIEEKFRYDPKTGKIHNVNGSVAGTINYSNGYLYIHTNGKSIPAHRLAWFLMNGNYPEVQIYHLNGDKLDNRWFNLALMREQPKKRYRAQVRHNGVLRSLGYFASKKEAEAAKLFFKESANNA